MRTGTTNRILERTPKKGVLAIGGMVYSMYDNDIHYASPFRVAKLFGIPLVHPKLRVVPEEGMCGRYGIRMEDYHVLKPDETGAYIYYQMR